MATADYALLDAGGVCLDVIVIDEDDPASVAVLEAAVAAKVGPHRHVKASERADSTKTGYFVPGIGRKKRPDGRWMSDEFLERQAGGKRRAHREGDEPGKPTGMLLDVDGEPKKGTELPAVSGKPATTGNAPTT